MSLAGLAEETAGNGCGGRTVVMQAMRPFFAFERGVWCAAWRGLASSCGRETAGIVVKRGSNEDQTRIKVMKVRDLSREAGVFGTFIAFMLLAFDVLDATTRTVDAIPLLAATAPVIITLGVSFFGCWSLMIIVSSCVEWRKKRKQQSEVFLYYEKESAVEMMREVRDYFDMKLSGVDPSGAESTEELKESVQTFMGELDAMGLAPPSGADEAEWVLLLNKLLPRVQIYGVGGARKARDALYADGKDRKLDGVLHPEQG